MSTADFQCYDRSGRLVLIVEARAQLGHSDTSPWAAEVRRQRLEERPFEQKVAFAIVTPDALYVWDAGAPPEALASYEASLRNGRFQHEFGPYMERAGARSGKAIDPLAFELIVSWWLHGLAENVDGLPGYLDEAGIRALIAGGHVSERAAA
jgi:hypothetical protein